MKTTTIIASLALALALFNGAVLAAPLVNKFFTQESVFVDGEKITVIEDLKHDNVCYFSQYNNQRTISCVAMH